MTPGYPVRAVAYYVDDVEAAAKTHSEQFGSGPFFTMKDVQGAIQIRGNEVKFNHSLAFGQWGTQMVEFIQPNAGSNPAAGEFFPYPFRGTMYHHLGVVVEDLAGSCKHFRNAGFQEVVRVQISPTMVAVFFDTREAYGHLTELYEAVPDMTGFFDMVAQASIGWDGKELLRRLV